MPRNFQNLSNTELMQEIESVKWMKPSKFSENKEKLQNLMEEKDKHIRDNKKNLRIAERNLNEFAVYFQQ